MKITFLGTGAADWDRKEHKHLRNFRRNASALLDDCLLIDPGPDVLDALETFGKNPNAIQYIINTHFHGDHYSTETVSKLKNARVYTTAAGEETVIGQYGVTTLAANHATAPSAVHFIISDGEKKLFYGLDGAWLLYSTVRLATHRMITASLSTTISGWCWRCSALCSLT